MENPAPELQRIGLKFFVEDASSLRPGEFIPVFHRWIQAHAVDGLLIDVADYEHVPDGPGVVLVAHEGNYCVDRGGGRMGVLYYRKQPVGGSLAERLVSLCRTVLKASRLLEEEPSFAGRLKFRSNELQLFANDRLLAPNTQETMAAFQPALDEFLTKLYSGAKCDVSRHPDPKERFTLTVSAAESVSIAVLLDRLGT